MIIATPKNKVSFKITVWDIQQTFNIQYRGIIIDGNLEWDARLKHIGRKLTTNEAVLHNLRY